MGIFARGIKLPNTAAVQGPNDADTSEHRRAAGCRDQDQDFHCCRGLMLRLRKPRDVIAGTSSVTIWRPRGNGIGSSNDRFQPRAGALDRLAQPLHGEFDVFADCRGRQLSTSVMYRSFGKRSKYSKASLLAVLGFARPYEYFGCHRCKQRAAGTTECRGKIRNSIWR